MLIVAHINIVNMPKPTIHKNTAQARKVKNTGRYQMEIFPSTSSKDS